MAIEPFATRDFNSQIQRSLAKVYLGAATVGEVMAVAARIEDGNLTSWHAGWRALADDLAARAERERAAGHRQSAFHLFLRAAESFRQAGFFHRVDLDCAELQTSWPASARCFQEAMALSPYPCEAVRVPFEGRALHACFMAPERDAGPWPTLIVPSGYDGSVEESALMNGLPALARGYAVLALDGPGQGKTLYDPTTRAFMRPDYETAMGAALDYLVGRTEVDAGRIAALGCSFGGFLVPRAAAVERRLAALVADPGQYDIGAALLERLPPALLARLDDDDEDAVRAFEVLGATPDGALLFHPRMAAHGVATVQAYCRHLRDFHNRDAAARITCPSLICDNEIDVVSTGQGRKLADAMIGCTVEFLHFTAAEGAGGHCEGMGREIFDERVYPWLDRTLRVND
ncbi:MAG: alpha/beta fold hydrolase [Enhydrobacter sp.]|nr:MAG: alpha/beta fold hydrolase [Enhydrobacter sp.]